MTECGRKGHRNFWVCFAVAATINKIYFRSQRVARATLIFKRLIKAYSGIHEIFFAKGTDERTHGRKRKHYRPVFAFRQQVIMREKSEAETSTLKGSALWS